MLEDRGEQLLAETRAVGVVGRLALAPAADPVRDLLEHQGVADEQLDDVRLVRRYAHGDPDQVTLALEGGPAALPRDVVAARPGLADRAVAGDRDVLAVLIAAPHQLGHVLVDVLRHQRRQRQRAIVDGRPVLDLEDGVRGRRERANHARVAWTERRPLDELDVAAAPPAVALPPGQVGVGARPAPALVAVAVGADPGRLVAVGARGERGGLLHLLFDGDLGGKRLHRWMRHAGFRHVVERARELLTGLEALAAVFGRRLPDDFHDRRGDRGRGARAVEDLRVKHRGQLAGERRLAVEQLVQDHAQRVDVGGRVDRLALPLLRRLVRRGAGHAPGRRQAVLVVDALG